MKKSMVLGLLLALFMISSCSKDDNGENSNDKYDGVVLTSVIKSWCLGDVYGIGTNNIDLRLTEGNIHFNEETGFEGEGTCLVLYLFSEPTKDLLPQGGTYTPVDWGEEDNKTQKFDLGFCEYQQDGDEWLTNGTYVVSIDKNGKKTYTAFTGGSIILSSTPEEYQVDVTLKDEDGNEFKARYTGKILFEVAKTDDPADKYQFEDPSPETLAPIITSADIYFKGVDNTTGLVSYKVSLWTETQLVVQLILNLPPSTKGMLPDGTYGVSEVLSENNLLAGYYENEKIQGSCLSQYNELFTQILKVWYIVSGDFSIKSIGNSLEIRLNGASYYGSTFTINYTGNYEFTDTTVSS